MKAWRVESHGGPEVLKRVELPVPDPGPMQARIRIEAVGINHLDLWVRDGVPGHRFPLPLIPGCDAVGVIDAFGPGAEAALAGAGLKAGSPVIANPISSCGQCQACLGGDDPLCPSFGIYGEHRDGGCADFAVYPVQNLIPRPGEITAEEAASLSIPFVTAWTMLERKARVKLGELVLIQAGGSGVSVAAIQIAKLLGADVITTVGSDDKAERARSLGADEVVNYKTAPFRDAVRKWVAARGRKGVDVVVDHVGGETFEESFKCLAWGGRLVTCGATAGAEIKIDLRRLFFKNLSVLGSTMGGKVDLVRVVGLVSRGKLKPVVDSVFPMAEYPKALAKVESRKIFGKVVVKN